MSKRNRGFSLPELLAVLTIIGILAASGLLSLLSQRQKAQYAAVVLTLNAVATEAIAYRNEHGEFPPDANPGIAPQQLPSFYLNRIWSEKRDYDWGIVCRDGLQWAKVGSYGPDDRRDDNFAVAGGRVGELVRTGDDVFKIVAIEPCP